MFWILGTIIGFAAALAMAWPIIRQGGAQRNYAFAMVIAVPLIALSMYSKVGTPEGIEVSGTPHIPQQSEATANSDTQIMDLTAQLEQRLQENPGDPQGWLLLGRTYKTMQLYDRAESALVSAYELAPENPLIVAELAEARMFNSGSPEIGADIQLMLQRALELDPNQQKSLWLMGFASMQSGDDASAIAYWERLMGQMDPASPTADSVRQQIDQARSRLGQAPPNQWAGYNIEVSLGAADLAIPSTAVLFVIARNPDAPGPPLGVKRIANPVFPLSVTLSDADSMMQELPVSGASSIQILARLSLSGAVNAAPGDPSSQVVKASPGLIGPIRLELVVPGQ